MTKIQIFVEGGGDRKDTRTAVRRGFGAFLREVREAARRQRIRWQVIPCGARSNTVDDFLIALDAPGEGLSLLLIDAEGPVSSSAREHILGGHPRRREVDDDQCHLMVEMMEAWLVADAEALANYYGDGFRAKALPARADVEAIPKADLIRALRRARHQTQKGRYHKIRHGADLLERVDPKVVRRKAPHCERLFRVVGDKLAEAR